MKPDDHIDKILKHVTKGKDYDTKLVGMLLDLKNELEK